MAGRILILDSVATNRIVMRVKLTAANYDVVCCATQAEASSLIATDRPDLILINMADPVEDNHAFCQSLRSGSATSAIGIICIGVADTSRARIAALESGADDVLTRPMSDSLMLARIRSLLRQRNVGLEWQLRDDTRQALGFSEAPAPMTGAVRAALVVKDANDHSDVETPLTKALRNKVDVVPAGTTGGGEMPVDPDLLVIDGAQHRSNSAHLFQQIAAFHSAPETRGAVQLVIFPKECSDVAAMALDLGADGVMFENAEPDELRLRIDALIAQKAKRDRLNDTVRDGLKAAVTDPLTGLYNRRYADQHLAQIAKQSAETGRDFALMILDIDHFKQINDTHGHPVGDEVLRTLAQRLQRNLRGVDLLARLGGEEFLIVMPNTGQDTAQSAADRIRRLINDSPFDVDNNRKRLTISVSIGLAMGPQANQRETDIKDVIDEADAALYSAKTNGRNMVSLAERVAA